MADEFVNRAYLVIDGTEIECEDISYRYDEDGADEVKPMNRQNRASGFSGGVMMAELSATVPEPKGGHRIDFDEIMLSKTEFEAAIEYEDDRVRTFRRCRIRNLEGSNRSGSHGTTTLTIRSLKPAPRTFRT